ncbi:hypothetical protein [Streptomyces griseoloalbus]|uniref:Uncharacterized protein n=1 Tax=Streptomyces griseoloalbus TaxID=67303 RepID=A0A7W8FCB6_9ACTN|nr:hypothetical protein [Streptomyces albaduncus]MBB5128296.1 hypothetical protein [Streptomyces albaduncus]GGW54544.1 hypothetical protein GCM10010340_36520 [Streptomyces albaduncus]
MGAQGPADGTDTARSRVCQPGPAVRTAGGEAVRGEDDGEHTVRRCDSEGNLLGVGEPVV